MNRKSENIWLFLFRKSHFSPKKNLIIAQQGEGLTILSTRDDNIRVWDEVAPFRPARLFFSILKPVSFKKLNWAGADRKIPKPVPFTLNFYFYF